eukprot:TRINITY_DN43126_c0_g1_i1.p1 TRINITY_DN43126_c0_g1~~TRINITY_DN43126_c0_g1_i1.p1  ORF type:complete len:138 (+),score=11.35 TRINITY_DN43126_c0_g1_i1:48-416(+)
MAAVPLAFWLADIVSVAIPVAYAFLAGATLVIGSNTINHVLNKKEHNFNSACGEACFLQVAKAQRITGDEKVNKHVNGAQIVEKRGCCRHGCSITVRVNVDPKLTAPRVTTGYHNGSCRALK